ncbi:MAG: class I SAM-dependent methyltransferase [Dehalococcoidia bacterium]
MTGSPSHAVIPGLRWREVCRLCDSPRLDFALSITATPPANALVPADQLDAHETEYPLDVYVCADCGHAQLLGIVDPRALFSHYLYVSGTSPVFVDHLRAYAEDVVTAYAVPRDSLVVEVGSNDGTFLRCFQQLGMRVLGVDPAANIAAEASAAGIPTVNAFFTPELAAELRTRHGAASLVVANNVFAHIDDLHGVFEGVRTLLAPDGMLVFEVGYFVAVAGGTLFDTIYHEHLSYHTVRPLIPFLARHGLELFDVQRNLSQGGSIRVFAQPAGAGRTVTSRVAELCTLEEHELGAHPLVGARRLGERIERARAALTSLLGELRAQGRRAAAYGAPAKATTLMYHFGLTRDAIPYIVDDNPRKQGLFTPGLHVPVVAADVLRDPERRPEYLLILAWNFADSIIQNNGWFAEAGGRWIIPLPELRIV